SGNCASGLGCNRPSTLPRSWKCGAAPGHLPVRRVRRPVAADVSRLDRNCVKDLPEQIRPRSPETTHGEVGLAGSEPATSALSVLRSNRLSYSPGTGRRSMDASTCESAGKHCG